MYVIGMPQMWVIATFADANADTNFSKFKSANIRICNMFKLDACRSAATGSNLL